MTAPEATDIVIIDETEQCPYLADQVARMPLRMPLGRISQDDADRRLAEGHRRTGEFIYQTNCPNCVACEPIRLDTQRFQFSRNHKRIIRRGDRQFVQQFAPMQADVQRVSLFNKHRRLRGLAKRDTDIDSEEYVWGFVRSCFDSFEITYWLGQRLIGVAVCDLARTSVSAVYTFYDPDFKSESVGTYSILKQVEFCRERNLKYLYLGYYVAGSPHMKYKSRFLPNERLINGKWESFEKE